MYCNYFINLALLSFNDFYFFLNTLLLVFGLWLFFFRLNSNMLKITSSNGTNINNIKVNSNSAFINLYYYLIFYKLIDVYTIHGKNTNVWFNHFNLNNFTVSLQYTYIILGLLLFFLLKYSCKKTNFNKSVDYLFAINNLVLLLPYLFFTNNVFIFLFYIETVSVILFYKLVSSKIWFKSTIKNKLYNNVPQSFINMIFFQYWVTFFSTIFIVYFYVNIFYLYGSTDWIIIQHLNTTDNLNVMENNNLIRTTVVIFLISVFFKLGLTPFHLFKIEVYKGLPYLSIFFYTVYYFVILFTYFMVLLSDNLSAFSSQYFLSLVFLTISGSIYVISLLFDVNLLKAFFAYSTIINTLGLLTIFISNL
jgi:NADH:ubiquinone oxidoreductase subunit 2 (subunit N)